MEIARVLTYERLQLSALLFVNCVFMFSVEGVMREKEENRESLYYESERGLYIP